MAGEVAAEPAPRRAEPAAAARVARSRPAAGERQAAGPAGASAFDSPQAAAGGQRPRRLAVVGDDEAWEEF
jgi:hypothetical protein